MALERNTISRLLIEILNEMGEDLEKPELTEADENTRLFGARSSLDSMNLVNFIAEIEERLSDDHKIDLTLANQSAMSRTHSPFRRVSSCVDYVMECIEEVSK